MKFHSQQLTLATENAKRCVSHLGLLGALRHCAAPPIATSSLRTGQRRTRRRQGSERPAPIMMDWGPQDQKDGWVPYRSPQPSSVPSAGHLAAETVVAHTLSPAYKATKAQKRPRPPFG